MTLWVSKKQDLHHLLERTLLPPIHFFEAYIVRRNIYRLRTLTGPRFEKSEIGLAAKKIANPCYKGQFISVCVVFKFSKASGSTNIKLSTITHLSGVYVLRGLVTL